MTVETVEHDLRPFERAVVERILDGMYDVPERDVLRAQVVGMRVTRRDNSGVGLFLDFAHPDDVARIADLRRGIFGNDVFVEIPGLPHGAGALLYVIDGVVDGLECHGYGLESWPDHIPEWSMADAPREM